MNNKYPALTQLYANAVKAGRDIKTIPQVFQDAVTAILNSDDSNNGTQEEQGNLVEAKVHSTRGNLCRGCYRW